MFVSTTGLEVVSKYSVAEKQKQLTQLHRLFLHRADIPEHRTARKGKEWREELGEPWTKTYERAC